MTKKLDVSKEPCSECGGKYVKQRQQKKKKISFIGVGSSGRRDVSEKHEELLWRKAAK